MQKIKINKNIVKEFSLEVGALFVLTFSMAMLWEFNTALMSLYIIGFLVALFSWKNKDDIILFIVASIFFQIGEIIIAKSGAWTYNNPSYLGIPVWITLSWGYAAVITRHFSMTLIKVFVLEKNTTKEK
jgi:hypothetical protein